MNSLVVLMLPRNLGASLNSAPSQLVESMTMTPLFPLVGNDLSKRT